MGDKGDDETTKEHKSRKVWFEGFATGVSIGGLFAVVQVLTPFIPFGKVHECEEAKRNQRDDCEKRIANIQVQSEEQSSELAKLRVTLNGCSSAKEQCIASAQAVSSRLESCQAEAENSETTDDGPESDEADPQIDDQETPEQVPEPVYAAAFRSGSPVPVAIKTVRKGTLIDSVKQMFPEHGTLRENYFVVDLPAVSPFERAVYYYSEDGQQIARVMYIILWFRSNKKAYAQVFSELHAFGEPKVSNASQCFEWMTSPTTRLTVHPDALHVDFVEPGAKSFAKANQ